MVETEIADKLRTVLLVSEQETLVVDVELWISVMKMKLPAVHVLELVACVVTEEAPLFPLTVAV